MKKIFILINIQMVLILGVLLLIGTKGVLANFDAEAVLVSSDTSTASVRFQVTNGTTYRSFPIYLNISLPERNFTAWGVQFYTDNRNPDNNGVTITTNDGLYGGFFNTPELDKRLPVLWRVYNNIQNSGQGVACTSGDGWAYVQDRSDVLITHRWNAYEVLKERMVASYQGLANYPPRVKEEVFSPIYLYLAGDFTRGQSSESYQTVFRLDLFHLGFDITSGGFATPNPFTPTTGQKTNFNFFLSEINAGFKIKIFTIRGRLIRTITTEREWDGRDDQGRMVEGGLYLYQIEAEGKRVSGTVVLIK